MSVKVRIPTQLRSLTAGADEIEVPGATVKEIIAAIGKAYPGIPERVPEVGGALRKFVNVYLDEENISFLRGLRTAVSGGNRIAIIPAVKGDRR